MTQAEIESSEERMRERENEICAVELPAPALG